MSVEWKSACGTEWWAKYSSPSFQCFFLHVFDLFIQYFGDDLELGGASALHMIQLVAGKQVSGTRDVVVTLSTHK